MKKVLVGIVITLAAVFVFRSCSKDMEEKAVLRENSMLIQQEINNVSKLVVTEGHFAEVYNYRDSRELFGSLLKADKKALVVVHAEATISYDLAKIAFEVDEENKTLHILKLPEPEIKVHPDFEYYDVSADYFNPFDAEDYNAIKNTVNASLLKKVRASSMQSNAQNRFLNELSRFYVLTNSMGWTLSYKGNVVDSNMPDFFLND
ncbi:MAG: DUF4230 domain-containing protein [Bacteroidota bacterium]